MAIYKCFLRGKQPIEIHTTQTAYEAQCKAAELWNLKPSKRKDITVVLAASDNGEAVIVTITD